MWQVRLRFLLVMLLTAGVWSGLALADFAAGEAAYKRGDFETALKEWLPLAKAGDAGAQHRIGQLYAKGEGVLKDPLLASEWYQNAANQNYDPAVAALFDLYVENHEIDWDMTSAMRLAVESAKRGYAPVILRLYLMVFEGVDSLPHHWLMDDDVIDEVFEQSAEPGESREEFGEYWRKQVAALKLVAVILATLAEREGDSFATRKKAKILSPMSQEERAQLEASLKKLSHAKMKEIAEAAREATFKRWRDRIAAQPPPPLNK